MGITEPRATDLPPPPPPRPTYLLSRWLFLRLLGVIYFIAFVSLALQITGLVGEHGILPARTFLERAHALYGGAAYRLDRKSTRLNSSHGYISYAVFCF